MSIFGAAAPNWPNFGRLGVASARGAKLRTLRSASAILRRQGSLHRCLKQVLPNASVWLRCGGLVRSIDVEKIGQSWSSFGRLSAHAVLASSCALRSPTSHTWPCLSLFGCLGFRWKSDMVLDHVMFWHRGRQQILRSNLQQSESDWSKSSLRFGFEKSAGSRLSWK